MNFKELLERPVVKVESDFHVLFGCYYNHLPEVEYHYSLGYNVTSNQDRVKVHYLKDHCFDGRRVWMLYYITFDNQVVMICSNAGREGDDHYERAIFNTVAYKEMVLYILSLIEAEPANDLECVDMTTDANSFFKFYGNSLDDQFEYY